MDVTANSKACLKKKLPTAKRRCTARIASQLPLAPKPKQRDTDQHIREVVPLNNGEQAHEQDFISERCCRDKRYRRGEQIAVHRLSVIRSGVRSERIRVHE